MASGVAVVLGSSLALRGSCRRPAAPVDGVVVAVESTVLGASPGGAPRVLLTVVLRWSRSVHHPRVASILAEGPAVEEGTGSWQHSGGNSVKHVYTGCRRFPQGWNNAGDGGTVTGVGGRDSGHTHCAAWRPDAAWLPRFAVEQLALNASVSRVGEQMG